MNDRLSAGGLAGERDGAARQRAGRQLGRVGTYLIAAFALVAAFATAARAQIPPEEEPFYLVGPQDALNITVHQNPDVSGPVEVRPDGYINLLLGGEIFVVGLTTREITELVEERLSEYIIAPDVQVNVARAAGTFESRIRIIGSATEPKTVPYRRGMTLIDLMAATGGLSDQASGNSAYILRRSEAGTERLPVRLDDLIDDGVVSANRTLLPGDVLVVPEGFFAGSWRFNYGAGYEATYTTNTDLDPKGQEDDALIFRVGPDFSVSGNAARAHGSANLSVRGQYETMSDDAGLNDIDVRLSSFGQIEAVRDRFFVDGAASISKAVINSDQVGSAAAGNDSNQQTIQTYRISPFLLNRFGDYANATTRYTAELLLSGSEQLSDSLENELSFTLDSGRYFNDLGWSFDAIASEELRKDQEPVSEREARVSLFYPLWTNFDLIGRVGWQSFDDGTEANEEQGISWSSGFHWAPTRSTSIAAEYGRTLGNRFISADVNYVISPRTAVFLTYSEAVTNDQKRLVARLPEGIDDIQDIIDIINEGGEIPIEFTLDDETVFVRDLSIGANTTLGFNTITTTVGYATEREGSDDDAEISERAMSMNVTLNRPVHADWELATRAGLTYTDFADDDRTRFDVRTRAGLEYTGFQYVTLGLRYDFLHSNENGGDNETIIEHAFTVAGRIRF